MIDRELVRWLLGVLVVWGLMNLPQLARLLDWLDDRVLGHRNHRLCVWIEAHYPESADC